jgi:hypothetical protein
MDKCRSPPKSTYEPTLREQIECDKQHEIHRRQAEEKLHQIRSLSFHHLRTDKSVKTRQRQAKVIDDVNKTLQFNYFRANPMPKTQVIGLSTIESSIVESLCHINRRIKYLSNLILPLY